MEGKATKMPKVAKVFNTFCITKTCPRLLLFLMFHFEIFTFKGEE